MSEPNSNVVPLPNAHAPVCAHCGHRGRLAWFQPDPNGERYVFERFTCIGCGANTTNVRPVLARDGEAPPVRLLARALDR
jgi:hypothetical protein